MTARRAMGGGGYGVKVTFSNHLAAIRTFVSRVIQSCKNGRWRVHGTHCRNIHARGGSSHGNGSNDIGRSYEARGRAAMVYLLCLVPYPLNLSGAPKISGNQNKQLKRKSKQKNRQVKRVSQYERTLRYENKHFESIETLVNTVWQLKR